jgi:radical SAM superfamily enzyme YgiQ (UPF0313 family)
LRAVTIDVIWWFTDVLTGSTISCASSRNGRRYTYPTPAYPQSQIGRIAETLLVLRLHELAGCTQISLGFESGSEAMLPLLSKRFTCPEVRTISDAFAGVGIKREGFLLLGAPGETRETVEESLEYADSLHLDGLKITVGIRIYPQTPLASIAVADSLIRPDDNLLLPRFYITPSLRDWLPERVALRDSLS